MVSTVVLRPLSSVLAWSIRFFASVMEACDSLDLLEICVAADCSDVAALLSLLIIPSRLVSTPCARVGSGS